MAVPTQTSTYVPPYHTLLGNDIDEGNYDITLTSGQVNFSKGFSIQTGTLTAMTVHILDSLDGEVYVDNTEEYADVAALLSDEIYKVDIAAPVYSIKIRVTRSNATNAVDLKVLCPNK